MAVPNANYASDFLSATLANFSTEIADNITDKLELVKFLRESGRTKTWDGGSSLNEHLMYALGSGQSYSEYEVLDYEGVENLTQAQYYNKSVAVPMKISRQEMLKNSGKQALVSLLENRIETAELTMEDLVEEMLFSDGTGNGGADWLGLAAIIEADTTNSTTIAPTRNGTGTLGNIDRSAAGNEFWKPWNSDGNKTSTAGDNLLASMTQMFYKLRGKTDAIFTTDAVMALYESLLRGYMKYEDKKVGDASFGRLLYKGIPMMWSDKCGSALMYWINSKHIKFRPHTKSNFVTTPFRDAIKQKAQFAEVLLDGNITCNNSRMQGVIHSIA